MVGVFFAVWMAFGAVGLENPITILLMFVIPIASTRATRPPYGVNVGVTGGKLMSVFTVSSSRVFRRNSDTTENIFLRGNDFDVNGVYAMPSSAQVVAMQSIGNLPNEELVQGAVSKPLPSQHPQDCVASLRNTRSPLPTRNPLVGMFSRYFDFGKDSGEKIAVDNATIEDSHNVSYTDVVVRLGVVLLSPLRAVSILAQEVYL